MTKDVTVVKQVVYAVKQKAKEFECNVELKLEKIDCSWIYVYVQYNTRNEINLVINIF